MDAAHGSLILSIKFLNSKRSSASLIVSVFVPIVRTLCSSKNPSSAKAIAMFNAFCPPNVGKMLSGFSSMINFLTTGTVNGSI